MLKDSNILKDFSIARSSCPVYKDESLNFKRNYIFLIEFKSFFKFFTFFLKKVRSLYYIFKHSYQLDINKKFNKTKKLKSYFFFIAEPTDSFCHGLFSMLAAQYKDVAFFIEWHPSKFFFFLRRKKNSSFKFFPIIVVSPRLYFNSEFMHALKSLRLFPIIFFFEGQITGSRKNLDYNNVFSVFLNKKNNLTFLLTFFKFFIKVF